MKRHWDKLAVVVVNSRCEGEPPDSMFLTPDPTKNCFYGGGGNIPGYQGGIAACHTAGLYTIQDTLAYSSMSTYINTYSVPPYIYKRDAEPMWGCSSGAYVCARLLRPTCARMFVAIFIIRGTVCFLVWNCPR